nr:lipopolysaccharide responsive and beige [Hymenolepis microstoma]CDS35097.1 lipopolysaccharide responsive and beige [Hymenolepis microstoma]
MPLLTLDPTSPASKVIRNRRYVGENMDPSVRLSASNFVVTADGRAIVACGYWDYSFRIFAVSSGQCMQSVVGGHQDVVTCLGHSESNATGHCYLTSGGRDDLVCLRILNTETLALFSDSTGAISMPHVTPFGHQNFLQCIAMSAELGLVFSGSETVINICYPQAEYAFSTLLKVPQTTADRLRPCSVLNGVSAAVFAAGFGGSPMRVLASRHGYVIFQLGAAKIAVFTLTALLAVTDLYQQMILHI